MPLNLGVHRRIEVSDRPEVLDLCFLKRSKYKKDIKTQLHTPKYTPKHLYVRLVRPALG